MDISLKEFVQMLFTVFAGGMASYVAIRSDLAALKARMHLTEVSAAETRSLLINLVTTRQRRDNGEL